MKRIKQFTGFAIALAWPQTYCKQPGSWYDPITYFLGVNYNNYYKVGHAALVLIDKENSKAHYFDFGRYHAPYQYGRVRGAETDHDLEINTKPKISDCGNRILNYKEILLELQSNIACHGQGELHAGYCQVDFKTAFLQVKNMQDCSPIPYGPFTSKGSNCSRFVNTAIKAGVPTVKYRWKLKYKIPFTPTPLSNVKALDNKIIIEKMTIGELFCPLKPISKTLLKVTLPIPQKTNRVPKNAQWLSGEGAGSWFVFKLQGTLLRVIRYSPNGKVECSGLFENRDANSLLGKINEAQITYPSNCRKVSLQIEEHVYKFLRAL